MHTGLTRLFIGTALAVICIGMTSAQGLQEVRQWASKATATSQYDDTIGWQASQATGEPDTESCGDFPTAWASETPDGEDTLTVYFQQAVFPTQINIHQTYNPGAITTVSLIPADGSDLIPVPDSADTSTEGCPGVFTLDLETGYPEVIGVAITVDQREIGNWNEIDAVELVGLTLPGADNDSDTPPVAGDESETDAPLPYDPNATEPDGAPEPADAPEYIQPGRAVTCDALGGTSFDNGVEFFMYLPRGGTYTFTVVGINNFDPVLAILDPSNYGICSDDSAVGAAYGARLPTTGDVYPDNRSAQLEITVPGPESFMLYTIVVGGRDNMMGEFLLYMEGGFSDASDGIGDVISMPITPGMVASGVNPAAYMFGVVTAFDAYIYLVNNDLEALIDNNKTYLACDDSGYQGCWGESYNLVGSLISRTDRRTVAGKSTDSMMIIPLEPGDEGFPVNFVFLGNRTYGDYVTVFHVGIGDPNQ